MLWKFSWGLLTCLSFCLEKSRTLHFAQLSLDDFYHPVAASYVSTANNGCMNTKNKGYNKSNVLPEEPNSSGFSCLLHVQGGDMRSVEVCLTQCQDLDLGLRFYVSGV